jgi:hypothetical protein
MKNVCRGFLLVATIASLWLVPSSFAGTMVSLDGSVTSNPIYYGEYVAPYSANNGTLSLICDDIKDDQYIGNAYNFNVVSYSSIAAGPGLSDVMFGNLSNATALYGEAAYLMVELFNTPSNAGNLTFAIWDVFDPNAVLAQMGGNTSNPDYQAVQALVAAAAANYASATNLGSIAFYTPVGCAGVGLSSCTQNGQGVQEFGGKVPEGGAAAMYLLFAGVTCFGAMFYSRRQSAMSGLA